MSVIADALSSALARAGWVGGKRSYAVEYSKALAKAGAADPDNTASRCPIHPAYPKPCQRCHQIYGEARKQQITQRTIEQKEAHQKWLQERKR